MARKSDDHDSTFTNYGIFAYAALLTVALFVSDLFFNKDYLDKTILGIIVGYALSWIDKSANYFFQRRAEQLDTTREKLFPSKGTTEENDEQRKASGNSGSR